MLLKQLGLSFIFMYIYILGYLYAYARYSFITIFFQLPQEHSTHWTHSPTIIFHHSETWYGWKQLVVKTNRFNASMNPPPSWIDVSFGEIKAFIGLFNFCNQKLFYHFLLLFLSAVVNNPIMQSEGHLRLKFCLGWYDNEAYCHSFLSLKLPANFN